MRETSLIRLNGNMIGVGIDGTTPRGNGTNGVRVTTEDDHRIGGTAAGAGNVIAHNTGRGVAIQDTTANDNAILANSIHSNGQIGIDLLSTSDNQARGTAPFVTPNDWGLTLPSARGRAGPEAGDRGSSRSSRCSIWYSAP